MWSLAAHSNRKHPGDFSAAPDMSMAALGQADIRSQIIIIQRKRNGHATRITENGFLRFVRKDIGFLKRTSIPIMPLVRLLM